MSQADEPEPPATEASVVGRGRPPVEHQFQKGRSGNPRGRPRKNMIKPIQLEERELELRDLIMKEAYRTIQVRENDAIIDLPAIQAVIRGLTVNAVKGNLKAQLAVAGLVEAVETKTAAENQILLDMTIKWRDEWWEVFEKCDAAGQPRPEPVPHPDEIGFNTRTGKLYYNGPSTENEKFDWDRLLADKENAIKLRDEAREALASSDRFKELNEKDIVKSQSSIDVIDRIIPDVTLRRTPGFNLHIWREEQRVTHERREQRRAERAAAKPVD